MPYSSTESRRVNDNKRRLAGAFYIFNAKNGKRCADCGLRYPAEVLDFDHRDPTDKVRKVSNMPRQRSTIRAIQEEIDKCDLVCANCHRMRTFGLTNPHQHGIISTLVKWLNKMR